MLDVRKNKAKRYTNLNVSSKKQSLTLSANERFIYKKHTQTLLETHIQVNFSFSFNCYVGTSYSIGFTKLFPYRDVITYCLSPPPTNKLLFFTTSTYYVSQLTFFGSNGYSEPIYKNVATYHKHDQITSLLSYPYMAVY